MEVKSPSDDYVMQKELFAFLDFEGSVAEHHQQNPQLYQDGSMQDLQKLSSCLDNSRGERGKSLASDEDEMNCVEEGVYGHDEVNEESLWQRVKWTGKMVKLLVTAVSYIAEDVLSDCMGSGRTKSMVLQKIGKWKRVSKAMVERGYFVSPQQCEDKFNNLNRRYKKLNEILGRGTSCKVVENPKLLDVMDIPEKAKEDVRKILGSKHLFYEEMCSYHNGNRLFIPHDPDLQRSLQFAFESKGDCEPHDSKASVFDMDGQDAVADDQDGKTEDNVGTLGFPDGLKQADESEDVGMGNSLKKSDCKNTLDIDPQNLYTYLDHAGPKGSERKELRNHWMTSRLLQLEEQKLHIKAQMFEIEKRRFKWQRICWKQERNLEKMRLENRHMKLENEHVALQIKCKKMRAI